MQNVTQAVQGGVTQVVARWDVINNRPIVFISEEDAVSKPTLKAFIPGIGMQEVTMDHYKTTKQLSESDQQYTVEQYKHQFGIQDVQIRHRLSYRKKAPAENRFAPLSAENLTQAHAAAPPEQQAVIERMQNVTPLSRRRQAAIVRSQKEALQGALKTAASLPNDATAEAKKQVADALARDLSAMILTMLDKAV